MADFAEEVKNDRPFNRHGDFTIQGMIEQMKPKYPAIDFVIHSVAFSPEIKNKAVDTSRTGSAQH